MAPGGNAQAVADQAGGAWPYTQPTWVFTTRTLLSVEWANFVFTRDSVHDVHRAMQEAAGSRNLWIMGGGDLARQFFAAGLLDEMIVQIGSVTLGTSKPLFPRRVLSPHLFLQSVAQVGAGFAELTYRVA